MPDLTAPTLFDEPPDAPHPQAREDDGAAQIVIEIPGPPRGKGRPRFVRATGRTYTDPKTENYEGMLRQRASEVMDGRVPMEGPLWIVIEAFFPIPKSWSRKKQAAALRGEAYPTGRPDADNIMKLSDALNEIVWRDDAQIVRAVLFKTYDERPRVRIAIGPMPGAGRLA